MSSCFGAKNWLARFVSKSNKLCRTHHLEIACALMMEGSGINKTLAQQFFADLAGQTARCDVPPEKSEQTMRIKLSSTPWVVPTTVDRRLGGTSLALLTPLGLKFLARL
jgi:hypothetical protein